MQYVNADESDVLFSAGGRYYFTDQWAGGASIATSTTRPPRGSACGGSCRSSGRGRFRGNVRAAKPTRRGPLRRAVFFGAFLNPTEFDYGHGAAGFSTVTQASSAPSNSQLVDVDGDGRPDFVFPLSGTWRIRMHGSAGNLNSGISTANHSTGPQYTRPIDLNGDGYQDLLVANSASGKWDVLKSVPNGSSWTLSLVPTTVLHGGWYAYPLAVADIP